MESRPERNGAKQKDTLVCKISQMQISWQSKMILRKSCHITLAGEHPMPAKLVLGAGEKIRCLSGNPNPALGLYER
jgi:hypothetical protein